MNISDITDAVGPNELLMQRRIQTDFRSLDGFVAGVDDDGQPYSADLHLDYAGKAPEIFNCIRIHRYLPRCGKEKVPFSSRHREKHRSAGFKAYQELIDI